MLQAYKVKQKVAADVVEALIGAFLLKDSKKKTLMHPPDSSDVVTSSQK